MKKNRIIAIDYGAKRIGIAISDPEGIIAMPNTILEAKNTKEKTAKHILDSLSYYINDTKTIIIGLPLFLSGKKGYMAEEIEKLKKAFNNITDIPIILWDERLTSSQAENILKEKSLSRKKRSKKKDKIAATILLQSYIDAN